MPTFPDGEKISFVTDKDVYKEGDLMHHYLGYSHHL